MRILTAIVAAGLLYAAAMGCNKNKNANTTPGSTMGDGGTTSAQPAFTPPPAQ